MNCIIVDDEPQARKLLHTWLLTVPGCQVIRTCRNPMEAYETLQTGAVDLMFLDIKMPVVSGTDFLRSLKNPPLVVFTTAYDKYALEGYELNIVDYLLKPITLSRLLQAIDKARERIQEKVRTASPPPVDYTFIKQESRLVKVLFSDIRYIEGMQNYIKIHMAGSILVVSSTMKAFEEILPPTGFVRVHRSYVVAINAITAISNNQVELTGLQLPIGISYKEQLRKTLGQ
jgi:DNA-binding LytR/AlgR family response regulator